MKRLCGLMMFCTGVGMALKVLIPTTFWLLVIIMVLLIAGYHLFCHC